MQVKHSLIKVFLVIIFTTVSRMKLEIWSMNASCKPLPPLPVLAALPLGAFGFWKQKVKLINKKQFFTDLETPYNHKPPVSNFVHLSYSILNRTMETNRVTKKKASHLRPTTNLMGRVPLFSSVPVFFNLIRLLFSFFI